MSDNAALARTAYETTEPFHVLAYFNPGIRDACRDRSRDTKAHSTSSWSRMKQ